MFGLMKTLGGPRERVPCGGATILVLKSGVWECAMEPSSMNCETYKFLLGKSLTKPGQVLFDEIRSWEIEKSKMNHGG